MEPRIQYAQTKDGNVGLRGFEDPVRLYEVRWERPDSS